MNVALAGIARRFSGLDVQYRRAGFDSRCLATNVGKTWRARIVTSKNENSEYRVAAYGSTCDEAIGELVAIVHRLDGAA